MIASVGINGGQSFRNFQFLFATTLVHEAGGHLLVTFLGNGRPYTPAHMTAPGYSSYPLGESGRYLELRLFGGTTEYFQGPSQDMRKVSRSHFARPVLCSCGWWYPRPECLIKSTFRVERGKSDLASSTKSFNIVCIPAQKLYGHFLTFSVDFSFPFARSGGAVNPNHLRNMGFNSHDPPVSGDHRAMLAQQYTFVGRIGRLAGYRIRRADARRVPTNPTKMLKAYWYSIFCFPIVLFGIVLCGFLFWFPFPCFFFSSFCFFVFFPPLVRFPFAFCFRSISYSFHSPLPLFFASFPFVFPSPTPPFCALFPAMNYWICNLYLNPLKKLQCLSITSLSSNIIYNYS